MWHSGMCFSGGLDSVKFTVGLGLKGLLQHKLFYDSMKK